MNRRGFIGFGLAAVCAPAIVRVTSLMPVKAWPAELPLVPTFLSAEDYAAAMLALARNHLVSGTFALPAEPRPSLIHGDYAARTVTVRRPVYA